MFTLHQIFYTRFSFYKIITKINWQLLNLFLISLIYKVTTMSLCFLDEFTSQF